MCPHAEMRVIEQIQESDWSTTIVCINKSDGSMDLARDFLSTMNKCLRHADPYPLPSLQEAFVQLAGVIFYKVKPKTGLQSSTIDRCNSPHVNNCHP